MIISSILLHNFWCCKLCSHFTHNGPKTHNFKDNLKVWFKIFALLKTIHVHSCQTSLSKSRTHSYETHTFHALRWTLSIFEWDCLQISTRSLEVCIFFYKKYIITTTFCFLIDTPWVTCGHFGAGFNRLWGLSRNSLVLKIELASFFIPSSGCRIFSSHYCSGSPGCICGDCNIQIKGRGETPRRQMELETCFLFLA